MEKNFEMRSISVTFHKYEIPSMKAPISFRGRELARTNLETNFDGPLASRKIKKLRKN